MNGPPIGATAAAGAGGVSEPLLPRGSSAKPQEAGEVSSTPPEKLSKNHLSPAEKETLQNIGSTVTKKEVSNWKVGICLMVLGAVVGGVALGLTADFAEAIGAGISGGIIAGFGVGAVGHIVHDHLVTERTNLAAGLRYYNELGTKEEQDKKFKDYSMDSNAVVSQIGKADFTTFEDAIQPGETYPFKVDEVRELGTGSDSKSLRYVEPKVVLHWAYKTIKNSDQWGALKGEKKIEFNKELTEILKKIESFKPGDPPIEIPQSVIDFLEKIHVSREDPELKDIAVFELLVLFDPHGEDYLTTRDQMHEKLKGKQSLMGKDLEDPLGKIRDCVKEIERIDGRLKISPEDKGLKKSKFENHLKAASAYTEIYVSYIAMEHLEKAKPLKDSVDTDLQEEYDYLVRIVEERTSP